MDNIAVNVIFIGVGVVIYVFVITLSNWIIKRLKRAFTDDLRKHEYDPIDFTSLVNKKDD